MFVHAKSHSRGNLFELTKEFLQSLPKDSIDVVEDIYGFVYKNGRDMSGFIDGTENPADDEHRAQVGLNSKGGSYLVCGVCVCVCACMYACVLEWLHVWLSKLYCFTLINHFVSLMVLINSSKTIYIKICINPETVHCSL